MQDTTYPENSVLNPLSHIDNKLSVVSLQRNLRYNGMDQLIFPFRYNGS